MTNISSRAVSLISASTVAASMNSLAPGQANAPSTPASTIRFTDVTEKSEINFTFTCGKLPATQILEVNGGGLGLIDFDNDGDLDLFVANGATLEAPEAGPGCKLFENRGELHFADVTEKSQIRINRWANGTAVGDYDGDGFDDIYVACFGPDVLLRNQGDGTFADVSAAAGIADSPPRWGTSAAFGDLDNDGDLDLYVANYLEFDLAKLPGRTQYKNVEVMAGPHGLKPEHDIVYENRGDGTFKVVTADWGFLSVQPSFGLNVVIVDFNNDGKQDITVANDSMPGFLFRNGGAAEGKPRFEEVGVMSGISANVDGGNQAAMGLAIADVDGNGFADKFTTVFSSDTNALHINLDGSFFEDRSQQYGLAMISRPYLGWSTGFYDFDHDGDEDVFMVNGHVYPEATKESMDSEYAQPALLFAREGKRFRRVNADAAGAWLAQPRHGRNAVFGDFDGDGDIDIITGELNGPIRVLRNETIDVTGGEARTGAWLILELEQPGSKNHRGLGSKIELKAKDAQGNPIKQTRWLFTGGGFQSSGAPYVHFAAPQLNEISLVVTWPGGAKQEMHNVKPNQRQLIKRATDG